MKNNKKFVGKVFQQALGIAVAILAAQPALAAGGEARWIDGNTVTRSDHQAVAGEPDLYEVDVPAAGILTLDVKTPAAAVVEPKLALLGGALRGPVAVPKSLRVIERTVAGLVIFAESPGTYRFAVAAQDPRQALGEYKLTTGFSPLSGLDPDSVDESEPDPDPDTVDESEPDPDPDTVDESEPDPDPDTVRLPGPRWEIPRGLPEPDPARDLAAYVCPARARDDHGDSLLCATALGLGTEVSGEIGNFAGDDDDVFSFVLGDQRTIRIETGDGVDTIGELYDRFGHRLATDDDGGEGSGLRIVKTLAPGRYYVRVAGADAAEGSYTLTVTDLGW